MKSYKLIIFLLSVILIVIAVFFFLDNKYKYVEYGDIISDTFDSKEEIVMIRADKNSSEQLEITDQEMIKKILEDPSEMELKSTKEPPSSNGDFYGLLFHTNVFIIVEEKSISITPSPDFFNHSGRYEVIDENKLYNLLHNLDFE